MLEARKNDLMEFDLTEDEKLALQGLIYKQLFYQTLLQNISNEINSYVLKLKERYSHLGEIIDIDIERAKIIYKAKDVSSTSEGTS